MQASLMHNLILILVTAPLTICETHPKLTVYLAFSFYALLPGDVTNYT